MSEAWYSIVSPQLTDGQCLEILLPTELISASRPPHPRSFLTSLFSPSPLSLTSVMRRTLRPRHQPQSSFSYLPSHRRQARPNPLRFRSTHLSSSNITILTSSLPSCAVDLTTRDLCPRIHSQAFPYRDTAPSKQDCRFNGISTAQQHRKLVLPDRQWYDFSCPNSSSLGLSASIRKQRIILRLVYGSLG